MKGLLNDESGVTSSKRVAGLICIIFLNIIIDESICEKGNFLHKYTKKWRCSKDDICIGVPVVLGRSGIEKIVNIDLSDAEKQHMQQSAAGVTKTNGLLSF